MACKTTEIIFSVPLYPDIADYAVVKKQIILKYAWKGKTGEQRLLGNLLFNIVFWNLGISFTLISISYEQKKAIKKSVFSALWKLHTEM